MSSSSSGGSAGGSASASASAAVYDFVGLPGSSGSGISSSNTAAAAAAAAAAVTQQNQGMVGLLIMLAVLCFIFAYCCWGAPFCRSLCRRYCCCCCRCCRVLFNDDANTASTDSESGGFVSNNTRSSAAATAAATNCSSRRNLTTDPSMLNTPTIILLPHGRMLVVDGTIFTQLQADSTGLDFVELGESVMRAQRNPNVNCHQLQTSQASIIEMDAETPSKDSMGSIGCFPPPTYESIYGKEETGDMPPSYSDILLHRLVNLPFEIEDYGHVSKDEAESRSSENCPHIISNPFATYNNRRTTAATTATATAAATAATTAATTAARTATATAATSANERNYSSLPRNSSLRSNPLDSYFVDNELAVPSSHVRNQRRRSSATTLTTCGVATVARTRRTSCGDDSPINSRTNSTRINTSTGNVVDDRFANSWNEISTAANDVAPEVEQHSSRVNNPIRPIRSRRSTTNPEVDAVQVHRYPEARYISDEDQSDDSAEEEETTNFKVLADIRESRV